MLHIIEGSIWICAIRSKSGESPLFFPVLQQSFSHDELSQFISLTPSLRYMKTSSSDIVAHAG